LKKFQNRVVRVIFECKRGEMFTTYYWGDKSKKMRWVGHAAHEETGDVWKKVFGEVPEGNFTLTVNGSRS
jgi:hypothetical protein